MTLSRFEKFHEDIIEVKSMDDISISEIFKLSYKFKDKVMYYYRYNNSKYNYYYDFSYGKMMIQLSLVDIGSDLNRSVVVKEKCNKFLEPLSYNSIGDGNVNVNYKNKNISDKGFINGVVIDESSDSIGGSSSSSSIIKSSSRNNSYGNLQTGDGILTVRLSESQQSSELSYILVFG
jgi:hypothetical protein